MLDVHPPHEPIHGLRDFLLHLLTITAGLLIALGLEAAVEWRHHVHLRHEAEDNIRREIKDNRMDLLATLSAIPAEQADFRKLNTFLKAHAAGQPAHMQSATIALHLMNPQDSSWQTAEATGALAYMEYREVKKFATVYQLQKKLDSVQDTTLQPVITLLGVISAGDPDKLGKDDSLTAAAEVQGVMAHVETMRQLAVALNKQYEEALKDK